MTGIQHIADRNTIVPDWLLRFYESDYLWVAYAVSILVIIVLIVVACRLYYELKEINRFLAEHEEMKRKRSNNTN